MFETLANSDFWIYSNGYTDVELIILPWTSVIFIRISCVFQNVIILVTIEYLISVVTYKIVITV